MEIINRKAKYEYTILEDIICGIILVGSEVKSIRSGKCNISDSYCYINSNNEVILKNSHISKYNSDKFTNHEELRDRKLLLNKREIEKLNKKLIIPGYTLIPLKIFIQHGLIKVLIGLCKGKKEYDKRETIKERTINKELNYILKNKRTS